MNLKVLCWVVCAALVSTGAFALSVEYNQMRQASSQFKGMSDLSVVWGIQSYVSSVIDYEEYYSPRWVVHTWQEKSGDCTDMSEVAAFMLRHHHLPYERVHGYHIVNETKSVKHDWLEVQITVRLDPACPNCIVEKKGEGYWK